MEPTDLTIEILKSIRDEVKVGIDGLRTEMGGLRTEMREANAQTNARIDETNSRLDLVARRVVESEIRTSTAIADLAGTVREMTSVLRAQSDLRPRVERCEHEIQTLKRRRHVKPA